MFINNKKIMQKTWIFLAFALFFIFAFYSIYNVSGQASASNNISSLRIGVTPQTNASYLVGTGGIKSYIKINDTSLNGLLDEQDRFGSSAANIGDLNNDGVTDLAVGAFNDNAGALWILFMNSDGSVKSYRKIDNSTDMNGLIEYPDGFGASVANIGDLNGDGVIDLAVGAYVDDDGGVMNSTAWIFNLGAVWILFMNSDGSVKNYTKINDTSMGGLLDREDYFGSSIANLNDLDGDGVIDLAVGAWYDNEEVEHVGTLWILFMNSNGSLKSYKKINNTDLGGLLHAGERFGYSAANIGDLNNDGVTDLAVGALFGRDGHPAAGVLWILFMNSNGSVKSYKKINDTSLNGLLDEGDTFGSSVTNIGDVNGDRIVDLAVGAMHDDDGGAYQDIGAVWILFMNSDGSVKSYTKINDASLGGLLYENNRFGGSVANMGDLDNDGITDLATGAWYDANGGLGAGAVWILYLDSNEIIYTNHTKIYANYSNITTDSAINGSGAYCEFSHNQSGIWTSPVNLSFNHSSRYYELVADGGSGQNHTAVLPDGNYSYRISCYSFLGSTNFTVYDTLLMPGGSVEEFGGASSLSSTQSSGGGGGGGSGGGTSGNIHSSSIPESTLTEGETNNPEAQQGGETEEGASVLENSKKLIVIGISSLIGIISLAIFIIYSTLKSHKQSE